MYKLLLALLFLLAGCKTATDQKVDTLPVIGLLAYEGVLMTEITAPLDVFAKPTEEGKEMFKVIIIAESTDLIKTEEGLVIKPDYSFSNAPKIDALFVPSAYDVSAQVNNPKIIQFIQSRGESAKYVVSNCAGAQLIGKSGIANGKKIVTWIGGGKDLQKEYPELKVQDETKVSYVEDGKFSSSNGNLATYISSLELLEKMSSKKHREFVESYLYLERLQNWKK
ncbi:MAG: DJ-1/PfpI family protein [Lentisphaeraceae bacterium]|nr:DJ-1/PfpI family protein [Lentisphaeraceae bacterium]